MSLILGIETSCDETGAAVFDTEQQRMLSNTLFSQIDLHKKYGGVVPEIASRSQLEKIDVIIEEALERANVTLDDIETIAVTNRPGLAGSLLVGICFAKALAWSKQKKLIGINHLEGHAFSGFLKQDGTVEQNLPFPHLSLVASGGHTSLYLVRGFGDYEELCATVDDAAGEAFDKVAKILGFGYPGGAIIEQQARSINFEDHFKYPRTKNKNRNLMFSFSGIKTAVLYSLVQLGAYDLDNGPVKENITPELQQKVASSLLVCITDVFKKNISLAFEKHPEVKALTFGGGVACNKFMRQQLTDLCDELGTSFFYPPPQFCTDNGGMIAFVAGYKHQQGHFDDLTLDIPRNKR